MQIVLIIEIIVCASVFSPFFQTVFEKQLELSIFLVDVLLLWESDASIES